MVPFHLVIAHRSRGMKMTHVKRIKVVGATSALLLAALFAFCLVGCGSQATSSSASASGGSSSAASSASGEAVSGSAASTATSSESVSGSAASTAASSGEAVLSDASSEVARAVLADLENGESVQAEDGAGEPAHADEVLAAESKDFVVDVADDSRAQSNMVPLRAGSVQISVPADWITEQTDGNWRFQNKYRSMWGSLTASEISGPVLNTFGVPIYDPEAIALSVPELLEKHGATEVKIFTYDKGYSPSGTLCAARMLVGAVIDNEKFVYYFAFIGSKSYTHQFMLCAEGDAFAADQATYEAIVESVAFDSADAY